jgi:hypothetical protein
MRIYEKDPRCWVAELSDLTADPMPQLVRENLEPILTIVDWTRNYLAQPHPELGRSGPVCPFVRPAMNKGTLFYSVWRGADLDPAEVQSLAASFREFFLELEPVQGRDAGYKNIVIIFPDMPLSEVERLIDGTKDLLKPVYAREGIMIGEFHPLPPNMAGLWNEDFRPLRCPLPMLAIRHMVATDFAFLKERRDFMEAYLMVHGNSVPAALVEQVRAAALRFGLPWGNGEASPGADGRAGNEAPATSDANADADSAVAVQQRAGEATADAAAAGCPHAAAALARAAAEAGCPAHPEPGAEAGQRMPVGRIANVDTAGAGK